MNWLLLSVLLLLFLLSLGLLLFPEWKINPELRWNMVVLNALILTLPLLLFYGSFYVLITAWIEHRKTGQTSQPMTKIIHWAPRIAAVVIIFFVGLFSLDVFEMQGSPLQLISAFIMHSIPSIVMIVILLFAWNRPVVGFITFLLVGLFFLRFLFGGINNLPNFLVFSGPMLLISAMFYLDWRWTATKPHSANA